MPYRERQIFIPRRCAEFSGRRYHGSRPLTLMHARHPFLVRLLFALCVCLVAPWSWAGAAPVVLRAAPQGTSLSGSVGYLVDPSGQLGLAQIRANPSLYPFAYPQDNISRGDAQATWFVIQLHQSQVSGDWVLSLPTTNIEDLQYFGPYSADGQALAEPVHTGVLRDYATRPMASELLAMRLRLPQAGDYRVYVRASALTDQLYAFSVWDVIDFDNFRLEKRLFDGLCYGILLAMLIYNLVLLFVFRDRTYFLYVLSGFLALASLVSFNGHLSRYVFTDLAVVAHRMNVVLPALWMCTGALFAHRFLNLRRYAPRMGQLSLGFAGFALLVAFIGACGAQSVAQTINENLSLALTLVLFVSAILTWRRGFAPAIWYLMGQSLLFLSVLATVMIYWFHLEFPFIEQNGMQFGATVEVMVFAVALGSRIRLMQRQAAELTRRSEHLTIASQTDPLTGVANRAGLAARAERVLQDPKNAGALLMLDLDKFKPINDQHGHDAGDAVLVAMGARLHALVRDTDSVARIGGDEFVILLVQDNDRPTLERIATRLLQAIGEPILFDGASLSVGGSLGIARFPGDAHTLTELLRVADLAMYQVKKNGRANFALYEDLHAASVPSAAAAA